MKIEIQFNFSPEYLFQGINYLCRIRNTGITHMKFFFSIFLILVMTANVAVSFVKQLQGVDSYELTEMDDDANEKSKTEKEKESFTYTNHPVIQMDGCSPKTQQHALVFTNDNLIHGCHTSLPELPPKV